MSGTMEQGHFERLDPPIVVGGVAYGGLLRFESSAEAPRWPGKEVLRFRVQEAEDLGSGRFAILAERRAVTSYATRVLGIGNSFEEVWQSAVGGNVGVAPEPLRIYSRGSDDCQRGDMREVRLEEGDVVDAGGAWGFVESVEPYAALPSGGVDWRVTQGPRVVEWSWSAVFRLPAPSEDERASGNPLAAPDTERTADGNGIWRGSGVFLERRSSPGTWDRLSRQVYPEGDAIPTGMTLPRGTYHLTEGGDVTPASLNEADGNRYWAFSWTGPWNRWTADLWPAVVDGASNSGPAHTGPRAEWRTRELDTSDVLVFDDGAGSLGTLWLFVRAGARGGDGWLEILIDGDRAVSAQACEAGGGTPAAASVDDDPLVPTGGLVTFRFARTGSTYSISATDAGGTRVLVSADLGSRAGLPVVDTSLGVASASGTFARFVAPTGAIVTAAGVSAWRLTPGTPLEVAHSAGFDPGLGPPHSVVSASGQAYAQATGDGARAPRRYAVEDGSRLVFYSDAGLVSVVASWPPPVETIAAPGRPPRPGSGVINAADEEDPGNPSKNRLNYCDRVVVRFPAPYPAFPPGRELIGRRGATLDPRASWSLQFVLRPSDDPDPDPDWGPVPSGQFLARPAEGIFLLSQDWLASAPGSLCFRLTGTFQRCHANLTARSLAEPLAAARHLDTLWQRASLGGGGEVGLGGYVLPGGLRIAPTGFRVSESLPKRAIATGLAVGGEIGSWMTGDFGDVLEFGGLSTPIYASDFWLASTGGGWHGPTEASQPALIDDDVILATRGQLHTTNIPAKIWTGGDIPGDPGLPPLLGYGTPPTGAFDFGLYATFKVTGIRVELPPQLRRCPPGALISAVAEVRLSDVQAWHWEWERVDTFFPEGTGPSSGFGTYHVNGVLYRSFNDEGSYERPEGFPPPVTSAPLGFDLVGRRRRTGSVPRDYMNAAYLWSNGDPEDEGARLSFIGGADYADIDADEWLHFGSAGVVISDVPGGKWRLADLSAAYSAMLRARDSACTDFYLVPRGPGPDLGAGVGELATYLVSLMPDARVKVEKTGSGATEEWTVDTSARGAYVEFRSMEIRNLLIKVALPSDAEAMYTVPIIRRAQPLPE